MAPRGSEAVGRRWAQQVQPMVQGIEELFSSTTLYATMAVFFDFPDDLLFPRQISRATGKDIKSVIRELRKMERLGILYVRQPGRERLFGVNNEHPLYDDLVSIFAKTRGGRKYPLQKPVLNSMFL